jgi:outer membrane protein assembly factor BamB
MTGSKRLAGYSVLALALSWGGCNCAHHDGGTPTLTQDEGVGGASNLDFGNVPVGQVKPLKLTLVNSGAGPLAITSQQITGPNASDFNLVTNLPASVEPGASVSVTAQFAPTGTGGAETATVAIVTDSNQTPTINVTLTGNGVDIQICAHPAVIDFGNVQVAGTPVSLPVVIENCGQSPVDISFLPIQGVQAADFTLTGGTATTLQTNQSINLSIAYSPHALGPSTASLAYNVCSGCAPESISLTGVGVDCQITYSPSPVNFGNVPIGNPVTQNLTATNTGTEACSIVNLGTYNNNSIFEISGYPALPISLTPLQTFNIVVTYTPSGAPGGDSDELLSVYSVVDPAVPARTADDQLSGNQSLGPCSLAVSPTSVNFGNVAPNSPTTKQVTLTNSGLSVCNVSAVALGSGTDPDFSLASGQATSVTVQPGSSGTIGVTFTATSTAAPLTRKGTLVFQTGDTTSPNATVPLSATINNVTVYANGWPKWHLDNGNTGQTGADTSALAGTVFWKFPVGVPAAGGGGGGGFGGGRFGGTTYIASPVVDGNGNVYQVGLASASPGIFYAVSPAGTELWHQQLSDPSTDSHPSTPAILADGSMFVMSGSDAHSAGGGGGGGSGSKTTITSLYYISAAGGVVFSEPYGEDGFDACPGLGNDGTLFEADDDGPASTNGAGDPYSAIAFSVTNGNSVAVVGGLALPIDKESERFGIVIADDDTSYWGNNGQFFGVSPPASGFGLLSAWPAGGVTLATADSLAVTSVISDLALDINNTGNIFAYSAWEDYDLSTLSYSVQGNIAALNPANGQTLWTVTLPSTPLPAGWSPLASDSGNAAPAVADDGTVYVGNGDGLRAINGSTGAVNWLFSCANVSSSPAIGGDGTIFFGTDDGNLYAVYPTGKIRFKVTTGAAISSSPAISAIDGTVYVTSDDGNLYAIH